MNRLSFFFFTRRAVLVAGALLGLLFGYFAAGHGGAAGFWQALRIPHMVPAFADTRTVTHSIDCVMQGLDPYKVTTCDPYGRMYNYPRIWLDLRYLGVTSSTSNAIGVVLALLTFAVSLYLFRTRSWLNAALVVAALFSFPVLFAVERGNIDLAILALLVLGYPLIFRLSGARRDVVLAAFIAFLTVLKIFPVAAAVLYLRRRRGFGITLAVAALSVVALLLTAGHSMFAALGNTPQDSWASFGSPMLVGVPLAHLSKAASSRVTPSMHHLLSTGLAVLLACVAAYVAVRRRSKVLGALPLLRADAVRDALAVSGLAIHCLAFILGASFVYRLVFLLPPLAVLLDDMERPKTLGQRLVAFLIVGLLLSFNQRMLTISHLFDLAVFLVAIGWLSASLLVFDGRHTAEA